MTVPRGSAPARLAANITERQFADRVAAFARVYGWRVAHFRPARTAHGWRTPVAYDGAGFPDMVLVHDRRGLVWYRELKVGRRGLDPPQESWRDWLRAAGVNYDVWRDADWPDVVAALSNGMALLVDAAPAKRRPSSSATSPTAGAAVSAVAAVDLVALDVGDVVGTFVAVVILALGAVLARLALRTEYRPAPRPTPLRRRQLERERAESEPIAWRR